MDLIDKAILFATEKHSGTVRKIAGTPYILHPFEAAVIIATMTTDENTIAAGLLHDTVEDCGVSLGEIGERFGKRVQELVESETEDKLPQKPAADTWMQRKEDSLRILKDTNDLDIKILWLGDKLSNIRSLYREFCLHGNEIWQGLNQKDQRMHEWYYRKVAEYMPELKDTFAYREYMELLDKLFIY